MINLESLESLFVVLLMMICLNDNIQFVSISIFNFIQENELFIINFVKFLKWKGVFVDDNGVWILKGS